MNSSCTYVWVQCSTLLIKPFFVPQDPNRLLYLLRVTEMWIATKNTIKITCFFTWLYVWMYHEFLLSLKPLQAYPCGCHSSLMSEESTNCYLTRPIATPWEPNWSWEPRKKKSCPIATLQTSTLDPSISFFPFQFRLTFSHAWTSFQGLDRHLRLLILQRG